MKIKDTSRDTAGRFIFNDLTGMKFNRLIVQSKAYKNKKGEQYYECLCTCGTSKNIRSSHLKAETIKSCGCLLKENNKGYKHGLYYHPLYNVWKGIKQRCYDSNSTGFENYGALGVKLDEGWKDFKSFYSWCLSNNWTKGLHVCRTNDTGDYSPTNCYIATPKQNYRDRKTSKLNISLIEEIKTIREVTDLSYRAIGELFNVSSKTIENAIKSKTWA